MISNEGEAPPKRHKSHPEGACMLAVKMTVLYITIYHADMMWVIRGVLVTAVVTSQL